MQGCPMAPICTCTHVNMPAHTPSMQSHCGNKTRAWKPCGNPAHEELFSSEDDTISPSLSTTALSFTFPEMPRPCPKVFLQRLWNNLFCTLFHIDIKLTREIFTHQRVWGVSSLHLRDESPGFQRSKRNGGPEVSR